MEQRRGGVFDLTEKFLESFDIQRSAGQSDKVVTSILQVQQLDLKVHEAQVLVINPIRLQVGLVLTFGDT